MTSILIVKTSSLGDIIQSFDVLPFLRQLFPNAAIDWVVKESLAPLVAAHPLVRHPISMGKKSSSFFLQLRRISYDFVFDLQGNSKSALITLFSRGSLKVGFGLKSVREWPNIFSTHFRFNPSAQINIRLQYLSVIAQFFQVPLPLKLDSISLSIKESEKKRLDAFTRPRSKKHIMVCPGSYWINKQLPIELMIPFLRFVQKKYDALFFLIWGNEKERSFCEKLQETLPETTEIIEKLSLPIWQNLMRQMDLVIAVDSSALHLCATTQTPSFSIFGPTSSAIFKPIGDHHFAFQGKCPYEKKFEKRCPILRSCPTGACIRNLSLDELCYAFSNWHESCSFKNPP